MAGRSALSSLPRGGSQRTSPSCRSCYDVTKTGHDQPFARRRIKDAMIALRLVLKLEQVPCLRLILRRTKAARRRTLVRNAHDIDGGHQPKAIPFDITPLPRRAKSEHSKELQPGRNARRRQLELGGNVE
jgi:hypothetical protein